MFSKVGLVCHSRRADAAEAAEKAAVFLRERGVSVFNPLSEEYVEHPDLILTFVNLGTVGFLTEEDPRGLEDALTALFEGRFRTEERSLLRVCNEKTEEEFFALNDAVVTRGGFARLIRVESHVNGELQDIYTADGLIVATPTGSTGYSLSAGGPIVEPSMNCMIITPVCAHSLHHCPTIISGKSVIRLRLREDRSQSGDAGKRRRRNHQRNGTENAAAAPAGLPVFPSDADEADRMGKQPRIDGRGQATAK